MPELVERQRLVEARFVARRLEAAPADVAVRGAALPVFDAKIGSMSRAAAAKYPAPSKLFPQIIGQEQRALPGRRLRRPVGAVHGPLAIDLQRPVFVREVRPLEAEHLAEAQPEPLCVTRKEPACSRTSRSAVLRASPTPRGGSRPPPPSTRAPALGALWALIVGHDRERIAGTSRRRIASRMTCFAGLR